VSLFDVLFYRYNPAERPPIPHLPASITQRKAQHLYPIKETRHFSKSHSSLSVLVLRETQNFFFSHFGVAFWCSITQQKGTKYQNQLHEGGRKFRGERAEKSQRVLRKIVSNRKKGASTARKGKSSVGRINKVKGKGATVLR
jgi:hypothetical protein